MDEIMKQMLFYHRLSLLCLTGMLIFMGITAILYKKENMKTVLEYFWRNRKKKMVWIIFLLCTLFAAGGAMQTEAEEVTKSEESEGPEVTPAVLEAFFIGNDTEEIEYTAQPVEIFMTIRCDGEQFQTAKTALEYRKEGETVWNKIEIDLLQWETVEEDLFAVSLLFNGDEAVECAFELRAAYEDQIGGALVLGEAVEEPVKRLVIDQKKPVLKTIYRDEKGEVLELLSYYPKAEEITAEFQVTEPFLDEEKTQIRVLNYDRKENLRKEETVSLENGVGIIQISVDGHYRVEAKIVDKAGNTTVQDFQFGIDRTPPENPEIIYRTENDSPLMRKINQLTFGYFAKERLWAYLSMEDPVSGVKSITYSYHDVDKEEKVTETVEMTEEVLKIELPFSFKGMLSLSGEDHQGNVSETVTKIGVVAESENTHESCSAAGTELLTSYDKTPNYYAKDVSLEFWAQDSYSGIASLTYMAGEENSGTISYEEEPEIITEQVKKEVRISAQKQNRNEIPVEFSFTDNAGHQTTVLEELLPKIHIDTIAPRILVVYDNMEAKNEKYYDQKRTATIYVTERNFDPADVEFTISGPEAKIHSWSHEGADGCRESLDPYDTGHNDACVWKCQVEFWQDGEYCFEFSCTDLAGNTGSYGRDEFVIDQTAPQIRVSYDNENVKNEIYYNRPRTAEITIIEENFVPEDVELQLSAVQEGENIALPQLMGWNSQGEIHRAKILYDYDAFFSFDISYTDLAGNVAESYPGDYFCVDLTAPEIQISEVADRSANQGIVSPEIRVTDSNSMKDGIRIELIGWQNGLQMPEMSSAQITNGTIFRLEDFSHTKESDDLYRLTVSAEDLAGNRTEQRIRFSVNRFGSVYALDQRTEKLAGENGTYYTDKEPLITITETNVDSLVFHEIVCSHNGKLKTLRETIDYTVEKNGDDTSWKQYRYCIGAENFSEEGHYTLTIYSEDQAKNVSDNQSGGKQISFAVDRSAPSIVISGAEDGGRYRENSRELRVDVQDNLALKQVRLWLDGEEQVYEGSDLQEKNGILTVTAKGKDQWQTLKLQAIDRAGNLTETETLTFLLTPNIWVQFYNRKPLFYGSIAAGILMTFGGAIYVKKRRKICG